MKSGNPRYEVIPGLAYNDGDSIKINPPPELMEFYDFDYELLPEPAKETFSEY